MMERLHGYMPGYGRPPSAVGIEGRVNIANSTPDDWAKAVQDWRELGATHLSVNTMGAGFASPKDHIDAIRRFKAAVGG
jgi:hypothetical protein